jgi:GntR family transcriptional regulator
VIAPPKDYKFDITRLQSVTEMLGDYGLQVTTRVLSVTEQPADSQVALIMELEIGTPLIYIERARYAENVPVIYSIDILPKRILHGDWEPKLFEESLFKLLDEHWGVHPDYTRTTIRSVVSKGMVPASIVSGLWVPWILLEQVNYTQDGEVVIFSRDFHQGEYVTFHLTRHRH